MLIISDIHGCLPSLEKALLWREQLNTTHLLILGDILNHGPRNPVPEGYNPAKVADRLNMLSSQIIAIRGNCDSEVDQMLCEFPITADYNWLTHGNKRWFITHGHLWNEQSMPTLASGDCFIYGHTHLPVATCKDNIMRFNPGSITLPKGGHPASFGYFDGHSLSVRELETGQILKSVKTEEE